MRRTLAVRELRDRLIGAGHEVPNGTDETAGAADVWPNPHTIVTVGLHLDPTLKPEYRKRYFACLLESQDNPVPVLQYDTAFALPEPFRSAAQQPPPAGRFMGGPFRWLLHRLLRFRQVLLWPATGSQGFGRLGLPEERPRLREWFRDATVAPFEVGAIVFNLTEARDCGVLWEVANGVSDSCKDWYVSDPECKEVYRLHHHEKVVACVPDRAAREEMLQELADRNDGIENCSGYDSEMDG
jgi:hypothetical protein